MNLVDKAEAFATEAHKGQMYGDKPYTYHLMATVEVAWRFGCINEELLAACWLHDTLEDTLTTFNELVDEFGVNVACYVEKVTNEPGKNRSERSSATYAKIASSQSSIFVKLCDRIANVEKSKKNSNSKFEMYVREYPEFRLALKQPEGNLQDMWAYLDSLIGHTPVTKDPQIKGEKATLLILDECEDFKASKFDPKQAVPATVNLMPLDLRVLRDLESLTGGLSQGEIITMALRSRFSQNYPVGERRIQRSNDTEENGK